ncbi:DUF1007 family protein [Sulfitobacter pseudonitzschiae]|uniref:DUF1007 family protein n=1 Tax=Pseudosulfitobacter pseudonitzschiae TaxID=1402135 RepID=A0A9Q2NHE6_9RHOB|nr:DUF1007 family protein [Pseudosulfitobacter pseudonitzschiae]MBM2290304.1 DUF1007 family protein [Pseudosulfitobacter pseudonitzschiae]MBM2295222.1 DUF1007 family protein [Pseudosulfitobacter pseudonitzschiae]MBM2300134.1 DUF1007 family protein [Pseudosulfitobacter pseudonitzschiae]MBM2309919.1 DUF1007 family protein [Pseudosulfitobacter pseudonitzschiae]MBM2314831.1 DUF1007 family protein [Pseudosulfitobacter pseudonitzschiae]
MRTLAAIALICTGSAAQAHPHIFIDAGLTAIVDETGRLQAIKVTWAYDAFYSLLVTEDAGLDADGNAVLTKEEEAQLRGFDMQWIEGYNGDLVARLDGQPLELSGPRDATLIMREGRLVTTHVRDVVGAPELVGHSLSMKPYDPTYYTSYDVTLNVNVQGLDDCTIARNLPDLDAGMKELQGALSKLGRDQDAIEEGFPEVGEAFATEVEITCAPR